MHITRKIDRTVLATLSAVLLPSFLHAQIGREVTASYVDTDVRVVLRAVGRVTETNVVIKEGVEGTITFQSDVPMTPDELREAMIDRLLDLGYEITDEGDVLLVGPKRI